MRGARWPLLVAFMAPALTAVMLLVGGCVAPHPQSPLVVAIDHLKETDDQYGCPGLAVTDHAALCQDGQGIAVVWRF
jgi:hypothetical protein